MADLTLQQIIDRFQAVLEAAPFTFKKTREPFSFDRQPNALLDNSYRVEDAGLSSTEPMSNHAEARIDTLRVWIARKLKFDGQTALEALQTDLVSIERYIKADGVSQGYHVTLAGRDVQQGAENADFALAALDLACDYDFSESV